MFRRIGRHRHLLRLLIGRNVEASFRGSVLGKFWTALVPLLRLAIYTTVLGLILFPQKNLAGDENLSLFSDAAKLRRAVLRHHRDIVARDDVCHRARRA